MHSDFSYFETIISDFESCVPTSHHEMQSRGADYLAISRIHAVTVCPMRCLKALLKVL